MSRTIAQPLAALAAVILTLTSIGMIVTVPPSHAASVNVPELA